MSTREAKNKSRIVQLKQTMRRTFGIEEFRPGQEEVIHSVIDGRNTLAIMPTGAGKSLCYQLPALLLKGTTIIVSPLISLMKDQTDKLEEKGLEAAKVDSTLSEREKAETIEQIEQSRSEFVFTTPERFADTYFIETLKSNKIDFIVIDEAHCVSQWGHDFRPAYLELRESIRTLGSPPILALTATATGAVVEDIKKQLGVSRLEVFNLGIFRPNLRPGVIHVTNEVEKRQHLTRLLAENDGAGIIYAATVKNVEAVKDFLERSGIAVALYHGRLSARQRKENQERFMAGSLKAMVATNAFGMGIDKPDIRFVIHYNMPGSLEAYYQEAGRAGRDGEPADCVLLYDLKDRRTQLYFMGGRYPTMDDILAVHNSLLQLKADETPVKLTRIQESVPNVAKTKVRIILSLLKDRKVVKGLRSAGVKLLKRDITEDEFQGMATEYQAKGEGDRKKLERMMLYAQSALCRWKLLLEYFGEEVDWEQCGNCDNCLQPVEERLGIAVESKEVPREETPPPPAESDLQEGDLVTVPKYGTGEVESVEGDKVTVVLATGEAKKFKKDFIVEEADAE